MSDGRTRYRVEHMDGNGVWHKSHRGCFVSFTKALDKRDEIGAYGRILVKVGNGPWEEFIRTSVISTGP